MKRILGTLVALGVWVTPVMVMVGEQPSLAQSRQPSAEETWAAIQQLIEEALQLQQRGKPRAAIEVWQQVLAISQQLELKEIMALAWVGIGYNSHNIGKPRVAIAAYEQALPILRDMERSVMKQSP